MTKFKQEIGDKVLEEFKKRCEIEFGKNLKELLKLL